MWQSSVKVVVDIYSFSWSDVLVVHNMRQCYQSNFHVNTLCTFVRNIDAEVIKGTGTNLKKKHFSTTLVETIKVQYPTYILPDDRLYLVTGKFRVNNKSNSIKMNYSEIRSVSRFFLH